MSRLDEIKARADAATEGPWVRDMHSPDMSGRSGWYIRGPRKLGLRSMVLNSRMLSGDAEFIEHACEDVPWLLERIGELNGAICWDTTCLNCASLLDSNYDQYMRAEIAEAEVERLTDLCDEFRKREESQDCIRERLTAEVERLERWKFEATEVMSGLRELGKALGLGLGVQITGPAALAEITRLTAERDALAAKMARVESLGEEWMAMDEAHADYFSRERLDPTLAVRVATVRQEQLQAALAGPKADTSGNSCQEATP